jgi:hypothetical protein
LQRGIRTTERDILEIEMIPTRQRSDETIVGVQVDLTQCVVRQSLRVAGDLSRVRRFIAVQKRVWNWKLALHTRCVQPDLKGLRTALLRGPVTAS